MNDLLYILWFFLPAGLANAAPVFANKIPLLNRWSTPMDFGKSYRGKRIFGPNKTWRGLVFGILVATATIWLQHSLWERYYMKSEFLWEIGNNIFLGRENYLLLGAALGAGALLGDAAESFLKRQRGIASGERWIPFDQIDYIIGGLLFSIPFAVLMPIGYPITLVVWAIVHLVSSYVGYLLGLKNKPI